MPQTSERTKALTQVSLASLLYGFAASMLMSIFTNNRLLIGLVSGAVVWIAFGVIVKYRVRKAKAAKK